jgi:hypothetical protein
MLAAILRYGTGRVMIRTWQQFTFVTGKSDPYVVVCYDNQRDKSKHFKNTLTPEFQFQTGFVTGRSFVTAKEEWILMELSRGGGGGGSGD